MEKKDMKSEITQYEKTIKCQKCGKELTVNVYPVLCLQNMSEKELDNLFSLDLYKVKCPDCGSVTNIVYNTIIVDLYKQYIIYVADGELDKVRTNINAIISAMLLHNDVSEDMKKIIKENIKYKRIVNNLNDMLEKMLIYDYDLNDKAIEFIKILLTLKNKIPDGYDRIYFNKINKNILSFSILSFNDNKDKPPMLIDISFDLYNEIIKDISLLVKDNDFMVIDTKWAQKEIETQLTNK